MRTPSDDLQLRQISIIAKSLWGNWQLKRKFDKDIYKEAENAGIVHDEIQATHRRDLCFGRVHADVERVRGGLPVRFSENKAAIENISLAMKRIGFSQDGRNLSVKSETLRLTGRMDAAGYLDGYVPAIIEVKVVNYIPRVPRSPDAAQLVMYAMASGVQDKAALVVIYVQPTGLFKAEARFVINQSRLVPLVNELMRN